MAAGVAKNYQKQGERNCTSVQPTQEEPVNYEISVAGDLRFTMRVLTSEANISCTCIVYFATAPRKSVTLNVAQVTLFHRKHSVA